MSAVAEPATSDGVTAPGGRDDSGGLVKRRKTGGAAAMTAATVRRVPYGPVDLPTVMIPVETIR